MTRGPMSKTESARSFEVVFEPEEGGGYHVYARAVKGCHSFGATKEEARRNVAEAIELWLESAENLGLPEPDRKPFRSPRGEFQQLL